ncbi:hypothetical protein J6590_057358 [Homalodisca vitripennis]|nr:hypothetical protein J6590_057358 [Homalodisca vitripennis]
MVTNKIVYDTRSRLVRHVSHARCVPWRLCLNESQTNDLPEEETEALLQVGYPRGKDRSWITGGISQRKRQKLDYRYHIPEEETEARLPVGYPRGRDRSSTTEEETEARLPVGYPRGRDRSSTTGRMSQRKRQKLDYRGRDRSLTTGRMSQRKRQKLDYCYDVPEEETEARLPVGEDSGRPQWHGVSAKLAINRTGASQQARHATSNRVSTAPLYSHTHDRRHVQTFISVQLFTKVHQHASVHPPLSALTLSQTWNLEKL